MPYFLIALIFTLLIGFSSCQKDNRIKPQEMVLIDGETFNETVFIDGHTYDGLIIENCIFENIEGDGLQIRDVDNLIIRNCIFRDIEEDAIRFRNSGASNNVQIQNNQIYNIKENGILAYETHSNVSIIDNVIYKVGLDGASSAAGAPHHGIYFQGKNFLISKNTIDDISNNNGNCISVRSYGEISANTLSNATKHGISYYSDHPGEDGTLLVQNNVIYDNGSRGINLNTNGNTSYHIGNSILRFNTLITSNKSCIGVASGMSDVAVEVYGNILIRTDGGSNYVDHADPVSQTQNLETNTGIDFVDFNNRDLHIKTSSSAKGFAVGITDFPLTDIDGDARTANQLDAGADEIN